MTDIETGSPSIGPLVKRQRGVTWKTFLIGLIIAAGSGAFAWELYGNEVRSRLGRDRNDTTSSVPWGSTNELKSGGTANSEIAVLIKDLKASQQSTAAKLETTLQLLTSEQTAAKATADAVAALGTKVDALQRPVSPDALQRPLMPAAKKPAPVAARKLPAPRPPAATVPAATPEPDELEAAPGAPTPLRR